MARNAPRIYTAPASIERFKALQQALDAELLVKLEMTDGRILAGTVIERPSIQQYRGPDDTEGTHGQLALDVPGAGVQLIWLDEIADFTRLGTH